MQGLVALLYVISVAITFTSATLTASEKKKLLDAHNRYRRQVSPTADNMRLMSWDESIADLAQKKADKCKYGHGVRVYHPVYGALGENIYVTSGRLPNSLYGVDRAALKWNEEKNYFNYQTNTCQPGKSCNHYTQLAWAKSTKVGCGLKYCAGDVVVPGGKVLTGATLLFCEYSPAGNVEAGFFFSTKIELPFKAGAWCSACPADANVCVKNLCSTSADTSGPSPSPATTQLPPSSSTPATTLHPLSLSTTQVPEDRSETISPISTSAPSQVPITTEPRTTRPLTTSPIQQPKPATTTRVSATTSSTTISTTTTKFAATNATTSPAPSLKCYVCKSIDSRSCKQQAKIRKCAPSEGYCMTVEKTNKYELKCATKQTCNKNKSRKTKCCATNHCNKVISKSGPGGSAGLVTSSLCLLLVSGAAAVLALF